MWPAIFEITSRVTAVFLTGVVIKMVDDYLDEEETTPGGAVISGLVFRLGKGLFPYGLLLFALAASLEARLACTLFLAAYVVGMVKDPGLELPTHIPAGAESLVVGGLGCLLWGGPEMLSSLAAVAAAQLLDDYRDQDLDLAQGRRNIVHRWGKVETALLFIFLLAAAAAWDWQKVLLVLGISPILGWKPSPRRGKEEVQ